MKILHLSTYDKQGGAAIAANLLHQVLNTKPEVDSNMLVCYKSTYDPKIIEAYKSYTEKKIRKLRYKTELNICKRATKKYKETFSTGLIPFSLLKSKIKNNKPDILHIHWAQFGFLNLNDLKKINIPIVWTLHDLWPISDGLHYFNPGELNNYNNKFLYRQKEKVYKKAHIEFIAVSKWVQSLLNMSNLTKHSNSHQISNGIDCEVFTPVNKLHAKSSLKLDTNRKTLLFGAVSPFAAERKGFRLLKDTLHNINSSEIQLIIFGDDEREFQIGDHKAVCLGKITNQRILSLIYSAADVMIVPSLFETFGLTAAEAMSCGTPVAAFRTSGLIDIIDHKKEGYLAKPYDPKDLANGIQWVLTHPKKHELNISVREKILNRFNIQNTVNRHLDLYRNLIS